MKLGYRLIQTPILFQSVKSGNGREVQKKEQISMLFETGSNPPCLSSGERIGYTVQRQSVKSVEGGHMNNNNN
jgi:hypothetical protein